MRHAIPQKILPSFSDCILLRVLRRWSCQQATRCTLYAPTAWNTATRRVSSGGTACAESSMSHNSTTTAATSTTETSCPGCIRNHELYYRPRWRYLALLRATSLSDYIVCREAGTVFAIAHSYVHAEHDITVTLIPLRHFAHPKFFRQVDRLCCQHESVLMEGRMPIAHAPFSTLVPARDATTAAQPPPDAVDAEGWEPSEMTAFFQPFSWGVRNSPSHTVIHAADRYDYEKLPWWCAVRFNAPVVGSFLREKHCLDMLYPLRAKGYRTFAIPWGALHMPVFHEMLLDNGFEQSAMTSLLLVDRIDGTISEGEYRQLMRWQKRRERRVMWLYGMAAVAVLYSLRSYVHVEYVRDIM